MLTPIETAPALAYDSARQTITPPPVVQPQALPSLPDVPVQQPQSSNRQSLSSNQQGGQNDSEVFQRTQSAIGQKLRAAHAYLSQLKGAVAQAVANGHVSTAKSLSLDAAEVSSSIDMIARQLPAMSQISVGSRDNWIPPNFSQIDSSPAAARIAAAVSTETVSVQTVPSFTELVQIARSTLGFAVEVVDVASMASGYSLADQAEIDFSRRSILAAVANVEAVMANIAALSGTQTTSVARESVDVSA